MTPRLFIDNAVLPALRLLPAEMGSPAAMAMLVAIGLQESRLQHRHQIGGPAHGYLQFERAGGVAGVFWHPASRDHAEAVCRALDYPIQADDVYEAIEHNDILAVAFGRLLLWSLPQAMPPIDDPAAGWKAYLDGWRPGKPHQITWEGFFDQAWGEVIDATKDV